MEEYITDIREISSKKVLIFVNDAPLFVLYKNEPEKLHLNTGDLFTHDNKDTIYNEILYKRALNRCLGLIKARDLTECEMKEKLKKDYYPEEITESVIEEMKKQGFLNDRRYAEGYISLYSESRSTVIIRQVLLKKGIPKDIIEEQLALFSEKNPGCEEELIIRQLDLKYKRDMTFKDEDEKFKFMSKVYAFLQRKGFSYNKTEKIVKEFFDI